MSSGIKQLIINTQERAVSGDVNRLQSLGTRGWAEVLRYMLNVTSNDDLDAGSVGVEHTTIESPLRAEIFNGLMVQPQIGSLNLLITPGVIAAIAPDGDADASVYKIVEDPGIQTLGILTQTVGGASLRVDIVEVQVGTPVTSESAIRDVFNVGTNAFAPVTLPKVTNSTVTGTGNIRIRHGTAGGAFPGVVSGWVPLAIISVPAGAANNDAMTFWDVRPLLNDRAFGPFGLSVTKPILRESIINGSDMTSLQGKIDVVLGSRRLGGQLRTGSPGDDSGSGIDMTAARHQESGFSLATGNPWHLYMCRPFGLPRWARYRDAVFGIRVPRSPRGIPLVSRTKADMHGQPISSLTLPSAMGLGTGAVVTTAEAVCVTAGIVTLSTLRPVIQSAYTQVGGGVGAAGPTVFTQPFDGSGNADFTLTPGQHYPGNARELYVRWGFIATQSAGTRPAAPAIITEQTFGSYSYTGAVEVKPTSGVEYDVFAVTWLPVPSAYPAPGLPALQTFRVSCALAVGDSGTASFQILGWRLG